MNDHQYRLWKHMIDVINNHISDGKEEFDGVVGELEGTFYAAKIEDEGLIDQWYDFWGPLEVLNAVKGNQVTLTDVIADLLAMKKFLVRHLEMLGDRRKQLDASRIKNLSFPGFKVEEMEVSPVERTLEIYMEGAWLEEGGGQVLGQGLLIFSNWESLTVSRLNAAAQTWSIVDDAHPESLKNIEDCTFSNAVICLRGLGKRTGEFMEWKMVGAQIDAEFEPEFQPSTPYRRQKVLKVSLNTIEKIFDSLIEGKLSRKQVASWAAEKDFADDKRSLEFEPLDRKKEILRGIEYLMGVDLPNIDGSYLHSIEDFIEFRDSHFGKK